jgi:hypothetical protein
MVCLPTLSYHCVVLEFQLISLHFECTEPELREVCTNYIACQNLGFIMFVSPNTNHYFLIVCRHFIDY